jgi:hypothetical protein
MLTIFQLTALVVHSFMPRSTLAQVSEDFHLLNWLYPTIVLFFSIAGTTTSTDSDNPLTDKKNLLNRVFAKMGWAWTSGPLLLYILYTTVHLHQTSEKVKRLVANGFLRWTLATLYWFIFTQWFFGPSILQRVFQHWPWASCSSNDPSHAWYETCRNNGHLWMSLDVSGHCFLLVHASLVMWEEMRISRHPVRP